MLKATDITFSIMDKRLVWLSDRSSWRFISFEIALWGLVTYRQCTQNTNPHSAISKPGESVLEKAVKWIGIYSSCFQGDALPEEQDPHEPLRDVHPLQLLLDHHQRHHLCESVFGMQSVCSARAPTAVLQRCVKLFLHVCKLPPPVQPGNLTSLEQPNQPI